MSRESRDKKRNRKEISREGAEEDLVDQTRGIQLGPRDREKVLEVERGVGGD
jgi:hypothetical protein